MRVVQLLPTLAYGDAVGNDAIALHGYLSCKGYETLIYAENIGPRIDEKIVKYYTELPALSSEDILLYHFSTGSEALAQVLRKCTCRKVMIYHNITPGKYFKEYNEGLSKLVDEGRKELRSLKDVFECCLADSEYNKQDLIQAGYTCPIGVLPILIPFKDYEKLPDEAILKKYENDGITNILFTGRIAPNKKQEDVIAAFAYYQKFINPKSRLFIVGSESGMEIYANRLRRYVNLLGIQENVFFTGHIPFSQILAYYRLADVFLCMSDHEGFCVPLVEAMVFNIPILAYRAAAVPETLGNAGIVLEERNPAYVATMIKNVVDNKPLKDALADLMLRKLDYFSYENTTARFAEYLKAIIEKQSIDSIMTTLNNETTETELLQRLINGRQENNSLQMRETVQLPDFNNVPIVLRKTASSKTGKTSTGLKGKIKKVLKIAYLAIGSISPSLANAIRHQMYDTWHQIKGDRVIEENLAVLLREKPSLLIDVTQTTRSDLGTGIQRVVNNIFREIYQYKNERSVIPVRDCRGKLITSYLYVHRFEEGKEKHEQKVSFVAGDKLLLLDSSWEYAEDFSHILDEANKVAVQTYVIIHDLFPIQYPELMTSSVFIEVFCRWHNLMLQKVNSVICVSRTTADVVAQYYDRMRFQRSIPLNLYYFHEGANVPGGVQVARKEIQEIVDSGIVFLMVGTLEPRKGHMVALQAFRKILIEEKREDCRLLIIGHNGWKNDEIRELLALPEYKDKVLWVEDASDEELRWAYAHSDALIAASKDEGFGLPLVEAAHFGLPIICSDIPIFREVTQGHADYFKVMDADDLARCMSEWLQTEKHPDSRNIRIYTWQESAQEILNIIYGKAAPYKVLK